MILLQADGVLTNTQVLSVFLGITLGIVSFFLREFYVMVKDMFKKMEGVLLKDKEHEQRIISLEDDVEEMRSEMKSRWRDA